MCRSAVVLALACLFCTGLSASAEAPRMKLSASEVADRIDKQVAAKYRSRKVIPAPPADDGELVRRLYLDLTGRIPDILAARDFADNPGTDKREKLIDSLLVSDRYAIHFANVWRAWVLPDSSDQQMLFLAPSFESWLRDQLKNNASWSAMVQAMVTGRASPTSGTDVLAQANQYRPEGQAAMTSRLFLGIKLECAQCHNHPFAHWQRKQFWEFAGFFTGAGSRLPRNLGGEIDADKINLADGEIRIPGTDKVVKARFLDGKPWGGKGDPRTALVEWMVAKDNTLFSRALVNRYWEYFFGTGLIEPVDEMSLDHPPSHPELLTLLAEQFAEHDFDLKYLIRAITSSRTYQLSSQRTHAGQADARLFARMQLRGLSPEQLFDSLALATGQKDEEQINPYVYGRLDLVTPRGDFLRRFPNQDRRTEQQFSILQALYLMNGKIVADATSLEHNKNLAIIARATTVPTSRRIEQLFLITLARKPAASERDRLVKYVDGGGPSGDSAVALCDVFWALLNSNEFCVNH
jgi:hypothetical protein